jgi:hypothetical protein
MLIPKIIAGAVLGAVAGFLLGRAKTCSSAQCSTRVNLVFAILACAAAGAALAWHFTAPL